MKGVGDLWSIIEYLYLYLLMTSSRDLPSWASLQKLLPKSEYLGKQKPWHDSFSGLKGVWAPFPHWTTRKCSSPCSSSSDRSPDTLFSWIQRWPIGDFWFYSLFGDDRSFEGRKISINSLQSPHSLFRSCIEEASEAFQVKTFQI